MLSESIPLDKSLAPGDLNNCMSAMHLALKLLIAGIESVNLNTSGRGIFFILYFANLVV